MRTTTEAAASRSRRRNSAARAGRTSVSTSQNFFLFPPGRLWLFFHKYAGECMCLRRMNPYFAAVAELKSVAHFKILSNRQLNGIHYQNSAYEVPVLVELFFFHLFARP